MKNEKWRDRIDRVLEDLGACSAALMRIEDVRFSEKMDYEEYRQALWNKLAVERPDWLAWLWGAEAYKTLREGGRVRPIDTVIGPEAGK